MQPTIIWGISADDWRTISIVAQGVLMLFLVVTGIYQLLAIRKQAKREATLEMCTRLATDATLCSYSEQLQEARMNGDLEKNPLKYKVKIFAWLNYLDMVAIGVQRGIYDEGLTQDYLKWIVNGYVVRYLTGDIAQKLDATFGYENLLALDRSWGNPGENLPEYEKERWSADHKTWLSKD